MPYRKTTQTKQLKKLRKKWKAHKNPKSDFQYLQKNCELENKQRMLHFESDIKEVFGHFERFMMKSKKSQTVFHDFEGEKDYKVIQE